MCAPPLFSLSLLEKADQMKMMKNAILPLTLVVCVCATALAATQQEAEEMANSAASQAGEADMAKCEAEGRCANQSPPVDPNTLQAYLDGNADVDLGDDNMHWGDLKAGIGDWNGAYAYYFQASVCYAEAYDHYDGIFPGM